MIVGGIAVLESGTGYDFGPEPISEEEVEDEMVQRINSERSKQYLNNLTELQAADELASRHTEVMNESGEISNIAGNWSIGNSLGSIGCEPGGETVAKSYVFESVELENETIYVEDASETAEMLVKIWMNSEPNRDMIMNPRWGGVGVGVTINEDDEVYASLIVCGV
ncbi:CAP domain-containing protein [Halorubrum salinarum]|uniref:CAP domain-containing protein n=1 Tax=Halorubrum salinarum TaxID=2739057 RepID=A0A7D4C4E4_9EURY|nr:CAP domain-containing protein [Halorubrum salinarum]QKG91698.1 CAP domain-containing protein [Halorubrum salinarum]